METAGRFAYLVKHQAKCYTKFRNIISINIGSKVRIESFALLAWADRFCFIRINAIYIKEIKMCRFSVIKNDKTIRFASTINAQPSIVIVPHRFCASSKGVVHVSLSSSTEPQHTLNCALDFPIKSETKLARTYMRTARVVYYINTMYMCSGIVLHPS